MIIENNKQLEQFTKEYKSKDCIVIPIECDINKHPLDNQISLIYVNTF